MIHSSPSLSWLAPYLQNVLPQYFGAHRGISRHSKICPNGGTDTDLVGPWILFWPKGWTRERCRPFWATAQSIRPLEKRPDAKARSKPPIGRMSTEQCARSHHLYKYAIHIARSRTPIDYALLVLVLTSRPLGKLSFSEPLALAPM